MASCCHQIVEFVAFLTDFSQLGAFTLHLIFLGFHFQIDDDADVGNSFPFLTSFSIVR